MLLKITRVVIVLIDLRSVGRCDEVLRELPAEFPDICNVVLSPFDAKTSARFYASVWEIVTEPARLLDLLAALESAHDFHQELADPARREERIDAIIKAIRQRGMTATKRGPLH